MRSELQANQTVLNGLANWYSVFAFTGGDLPCGHCTLAAIDSYLEHPFATECVSIEDVKRYRSLLESITTPKAGIPARPRSFRGRKQIADAFALAATEIRILGNSLDAAQGQYERLTGAQPMNPFSCVDSPFGHGRKDSRREPGERHVASQSPQPIVYLQGQRIRE